VAIFANLGLARFGKFSEVFFDAGAEATLAGLNSGALHLDIGCTCSRRPALLRHRGGCGKQHRSADYCEALHHGSSPRQKKATGWNDAAMKTRHS
jgi:hypothetical protein